MALKTLVIVAVVIVAIGYMAYEPLPETIAEPWNMRSRRLLQYGVILGAKVWSIVHGGEDWVHLRSIFTHVIPAPEPVDPSDDSLKVIDTKFNNITVRIYQPKSSQQLPGLVLLHGGAWILGSFVEYDSLMRKITKDVNVVIVFVEYRLAPENKYPAGFDDCVEATKYFMEKAQTYGVDPNRIGVMGDSAGGNLAAAVALKLRDTQWKPQLRTQVLLYPVLQACDNDLPIRTVLKRTLKFPISDFRGQYVCYTDEECHVYLGTKKYITPQLQKLCAKYVNEKYIPKDMIPEGFIKNPNPNIGESPAAIAISEKISDPYAFPLMAPSLSNLPRAYVFTVELDELRDEGIIYAKRMEEDGVQVEWVHFDNTTHGILHYHDDQPHTSAYQRLIVYLKFNL